MLDSKSQGKSLAWVLMVRYKFIRQKGTGEEKKFQKEWCVQRWEVLSGFGLICNDRSTQGISSYRAQKGQVRKGLLFTQLILLCGSETGAVFSAEQVLEKHLLMTFMFMTQDLQAQMCSKRPCGPEVLRTFCW